MRSVESTEGFSRAAEVELLRAGVSYPSHNTSRAGFRFSEERDSRPGKRQGGSM
jgi:hypothetical protein